MDVSQKVLSSVVVLSLFCTSTLQAASGNVRDSLLHEGNRELGRENLTLAEALFRAALDIDSHCIRAQMGLGAVAVKEQKWSDGTKIFEELLGRDSANIEAEYYAGICRRENGVERAWMSRAGEWRKAERHFRRVIARDSLFRDVLYQYAALLSYREEHERALDLAERQIDLWPDQSQTTLQVLSLFRRYIGLEGGTEDVLSVFLGRESEFRRYFAGEVLRRLGRLQEAGSFFRLLCDHPSRLPREASSLGLARVAFAAGDPVQGEQFYWQAVDGISSWLGAALLFEDIKYIVSDSELKAYSALTSDRKKSAFFHTFWALRNPAPAHATNLRLAEHYRRLFYAEKYFEYCGFRTEFNNPDREHYLLFPRSYGLNQEFSDKGLIYLRHGEPSQKFKSGLQHEEETGSLRERIKEIDASWRSWGPTDDVLRTNIPQGTQADKRTSGSKGRFGGNEFNESWVYQASAEAPLRIFTFILHNTVGNNWRLASLPSDREMLENLAVYDSRYQSLLRASDLAFAGAEARLIDESKATVNAAFSTDRQTWKKDIVRFAIPHSIDAFRGAGGKTLLHISFGLPMTPFRKHLPDSESTARIEAGLALSDSLGTVLDWRRDTVVVKLSPDGNGIAIELYRQLLAPQALQVSMHAQCLQADIIGNWKETLRVPDFSGQAPSLSDVQFLLPSTASSSIEIHGVKVVVSPFSALPRNHPLLVYWQVYNLTINDEGRSRYRAEVLLTPGNSAPNEDTKVVYTNDVEGREVDASEFARIDLSRFSKGTYILTVRLTDRLRGLTLEKSRTVELVGS